MRYRLVVFDIDGTLADTFPFFLSILGELADKHRFRRVRSGEVESLRTQHARGVLKALGIPWWKVPAVGRSYRSMMASRIGEIRLFPEVPNFLKRLRESGLRLGVVTSNSIENTRRIFHEETFAQFDHLSCHVALFGKKAKLKALLQESGLSPDQVLYVGDELRDLDAARCVGMAFAAVPWGYTTQDSLAEAKPDHLVASFGELERLLMEP